MTDELDDKVKAALDAALADTRFALEVFDGDHVLIPTIESDLTVLDSLCRKLSECFPTLQITLLTGTQMNHAIVKRRMSFQTIEEAEEFLNAGVTMVPPHPDD